MTTCPVPCPGVTGCETDGLRGDFGNHAGGGQGRGRTADLPIFSRTLVPTELPGPTLPREELATPTGLEPATSAVTGRRANQLRYGASMTQGRCARACLTGMVMTQRIPNGIRTRAAAVKGRSPRPLDDGDPGGAPDPRRRRAALGSVEDPASIGDREGGRQIRFGDVHPTYAALACRLRQRPHWCHDRPSAAPLVRVA